MTHIRSKLLWLKAVILLVGAGAGAMMLLKETNTPVRADSSPSAGASFPGFESGQVRPLAMSRDRTRLFAVNTPDNTLEIFGLGAQGLKLQARVPVGL